MKRLCTLALIAVITPFSTSYAESSFDWQPLNEYKGVPKGQYWQFKTLSVDKANRIESSSISTNCLSMNMNTLVMTPAILQVFAEKDYKEKVRTIITTLYLDKKMGVSTPNYKFRMKMLIDNHDFKNELIMETDRIDTGKLMAYQFDIYDVKKKQFKEDESLFLNRFKKGLEVSFEGNLENGGNVMVKCSLKGFSRGLKQLRSINPNI